MLTGPASSDGVEAAAVVAVTVTLLLLPMFSKPQMQQKLQTAAAHSTKSVSAGSVSLHSVLYTIRQNTARHAGKVKLKKFCIFTLILLIAKNASF